MSWLSEIEKQIEVRYVSPKEAGRMARVIREMSGVVLWAEKLAEAFDGNDPDKVTIVGLRLGKLRSVLSNLSPDAKALVK